MHRVVEVIDTVFLSNRIHTSPGETPGIILAGAAISIRSPATSDISSQLYDKPFTFERLLVQNNSLRCDACGLTGSFLTGAGVSLVFDFAANPRFFNCNFTENTAWGNFGLFQALGGGLYMKPPNDQAAVISGSIFANNALAAFGRAAGAGIFAETIFTGSIDLNLTESQFLNNSATCQGETESWFCAGGAIHAGSSRDTIRVVRSTFELNVIDSHSCSGESRGGAIYSPGSTSVVESHFVGNGVRGDRAFGGALSIAHAAVKNCSFSGNWIRAYFAGFGGAIRAEGANFTIQDSSLDASFAVTSRSSDNLIDCGRIWGSVVNRGLFAAGTFGGSISIDSASWVRVTNVSIANSRADRGGGIALSNPPAGIASSYVAPRCANCSASVTGGGVFLFDAAAGVHAVLRAVCAPGFCQNCSATLYGGNCSTAPTKFVSTPSNPLIVSPQQRARFSFSFVDALGQKVVGIEEPMSVALLRSVPEGILSLQSGSPRDAVLSDATGEFVFPNLAIFSPPNSTALLEFSSATPMLNRERRPLIWKNTLNISVVVASCLPGYFSSSSKNSSSPWEFACQSCIAGTYKLTGRSNRHSQECLRCGEEEGEHAEKGCLSLPSASDYDRFWTVASGFYPIPTLQSPSELARCPNHACLPFECVVRRHP